MARIDIEKLTLESLAYRDFEDVFLDASFDFSDLSESTSKFRLHNGRRDKVRGRMKGLPIDDPAIVFAMYALQNLTMLSSDFEFQRNALMKFFQVYIEQTIEEVGDDLQLSPEVSLLLENLSSMSSREMYQNHTLGVKGASSLLQGLSALSAKLIGEIYTSVVHHRISHIELQDFPLKLGQTIYKDINKNKNFVILTPSAKSKKIVFKTEGRNLYLFNETNEIYAVLFDVDHWFVTSKKNKNFLGKRKTSWRELKEELGIKNHWKARNSESCSKMLTNI